MTVGILPTLTIVFVVLKLTDVIDWSWWWVLFPTLLPLGVLLAIWLLKWCATVARERREVRNFRRELRALDRGE